MHSFSHPNTYAELNVAEVTSIPAPVGAESMVQLTHRPHVQGRARVRQRSQDAVGSGPRVVRPRMMHHPSRPVTRSQTGGSR